VILADSSAWIEYLRRTGSSVNRRFLRAFEEAELVTTEVVVMELLAGTRSEFEERWTRKMLATVPLVRLGGLAEWEDAATISRLCRDAGETVAGHLDCLLSAVAIREKVPVLHADRDFDVIARHTALQIAAG
jgi:predicted nucleic acid-binding protein